MSTALRGRILVVDDTEEVRRYICDLLRQAGYDVTEAVDGEDAKKKVEGADVVFLDLEMPKLSGEGFIAWLRARGNYVPVVVVSAYSDRAHALRHVKGYDIVHVLEKPIRPEQLLHRATSCMSFTTRVGNIPKATSAIASFIARAKPLTS